jgi:hypothetical protein
MPVGGRISDGTYLSSGGYRPAYADSIPTAYQARQNALANMYARRLGFQGVPDFQSQASNARNLNAYTNRAQQGLGYTFNNGTWGPATPGQALPSSYATRYAAPQFNNMVSNYQQNPQNIANLLAMLQNYMRGSSYAR